MKRLYSHHNNQMELTFFDLGLFNDNSNTTLIDSVNCAKFAETLGYSRYWIGEHHDANSAWRSTEIPITLLAGSTNSIKVGSAGVLIRFHNPLLTAQNFRVLNNLFPGRIDLGFSKGLVNPNVAAQLIGNNPPFDYNENLLSTKFFLSEFESPAMPIALNYSLPELWVMGSSLNSLQYAMDNNLHCCLSLCHDNNTFVQIQKEIDRYHKLKEEGEKKNLKIGILITILIVKNKSKYDHIKKTVVHNALQINLGGTESEAHAFVTDLTRILNPDLIAIGNIYGTKMLKYSQMRKIHGIVINAPG